MKTYTTWDAIGDMFIIYGIVIVISRLVAVVILGIVWALSRQAKQEATKALAKPAPALAAAQPVIAGIPQEHLAVITRSRGGDDGRAPDRPHRNGRPQLRLDRRGPHGPSHLARAARIALNL